MAVIPQEVQDLFNKVPAVYFGTATADAQPNINIIGIKQIVDDSTIYLSDQFFNKTLANLKENDKVAIAFWDGPQAYQIYGTARYVNDGEEFAEKKAWADGIFAAKGAPVVAKGGCFVDVTAVYQVASGPAAGSQIA